MRGRSSFDDQGRISVGFEKLEKPEPESFFGTMGRCAKIVGKSLKIGLMGLGIFVAAVIGAGLSIISLGLKALFLMPTATLLESPGHLLDGIGHLFGAAGNALGLGVSVLALPIVMLSSKAETSTQIQNNISSMWDSMKTNVKGLLGNALSIVTAGVVTPEFGIRQAYIESLKLDRLGVIGKGEHIGSRDTNEMEYNASAGQGWQRMVPKKESYLVAGTGLVGAIERAAKEIDELVEGRSEVKRGEDQRHSGPGVFV